MEEPAGRRAAPADVEALAWLLDSSIPVPGTSWRVGVDALIGLVPGIGDIVSGGLGLLVVARGAQLRLPPVVVARMLANVALDFVIGAIPVIGDVFDAWYKANLRNVALIQRHSTQPEAPTVGSWAFLGALLAVVVAMALGTVWLIGWLLALAFA